MKDQLNQQMPTAKSAAVSTSNLLMVGNLRTIKRRGFQKEETVSFHNIFPGAVRPLFEHCNFLTDGKIAKIGHFLAKLEGNGARLYFSCFFIRLDMSYECDKVRYDQL